MKNEIITRKQIQGFTLIEVIIVVAIIGILAAIGMSAYQGYIQKARVTSLVFPGLHSIETNLAIYYAHHQQLPTSAANIRAMEGDADTTYFNMAYGSNFLELTIVSPPGINDKLSKLDGYVLRLTPSLGADDNISTWDLSGPLAVKLGLSGEN